MAVYPEYFFSVPLHRHAVCKRRPYIRDSLGLRVDIRIGIEDTQRSGTGETESRSQPDRRCGRFVPLPCHWPKRSRVGSIGAKLAFRRPWREEPFVIIEWKRPDQPPPSIRVSLGREPNLLITL